MSLQPASVSAVHAGTKVAWIECDQDIGHPMTKIEKRKYDMNEAD